MSFKRQKVMAVLGRMGVAVVREGGAHTIVQASSGKRTSVPRHNELDRTTVRAIVKQLGLNWRDIEEHVR